MGTRGDRALREQTWGKFQEGTVEGKIRDDVVRKTEEGMNISHEGGIMMRT